MTLKNVHPLASLRCTLFRFVSLSSPDARRLAGVKATALFGALFLTLTNQRTEKSMKNLKVKIKKIIQESDNDLTKYVANYAINNYSNSEEIKNFFEDLMNHGCVCGMVGELIYYSDTHAFYDKFYSEIEELRQEYESSVGEQLLIKNDLKNFLAWFGFEETARNIADQIGLEI